MRSNTYTEPVDFIPKSIRKKYKLGEFNTDTNKKETTTKKKETSTKKK